MCFTGVLDALTPSIGQAQAVKAEIAVLEKSGRAAARDLSRWATNIDSDGNPNKSAEVDCLGRTATEALKCRSEKRRLATAEASSGHSEIIPREA